MHNPMYYYVVIVVTEKVRVKDECERKNLFNLS